MSRISSKRLKLVLVFGLMLAAALLAACSGTPSDKTEAAKPEASEAAAGGPMTVKIIDPAEGAEVPAGTVSVAIETSGIKFSMPSNTLVDGEGHVHFTLDDRPFEMSVEKEIEFKDVKPGTHTLKAELVQNNTDPFDPPVEQVIEFSTK